MTTGEKITLLRKKNGITQEQFAELLEVSRQSVSRWEKNIAFPEVEKLIKISRFFDCSIDYLLNENENPKEQKKLSLSADECFKFIRESGYFFLATSVDNKPSLRPFGMIYSDGNALFIITDKRKNVYKDLTANSNIELASYNGYSRRWIRISGKVVEEYSQVVKEKMTFLYPSLKQQYLGEDGVFIIIFRVYIEKVIIN